MDIAATVVYRLHMFELRQTPVFETWFLGLRKKHRAREAIAKRLVRLEAGNFGDTKALGGGVNELRIQHGPGYRTLLHRAAPVDHPLAVRRHQGLASPGYSPGQSAGEGDG